MTWHPPRPEPFDHSRCAAHRTVQGIEHFCEREKGHGDDHVFAFTAGQLQSLLWELQNPSRPAFPSEAALLMISAVGVAVFTRSTSATDWAASLVMMALAIRWLRIWAEARKGGSRT